MRKQIESWLQARWYGDHRPGLLLRSLAGVQAGLAKLNRRRLAQAWRAPVPVVVVGNLSVGGTGKTPFVAWLASTLRDRGHRVGIVSRGYRRQGRETLHVEKDSRWQDVGDEPLLLRRMSDCPVVVGRNRVAACRLLLDTAPVDLILCDDGLQHYRLGRDMEIAIIDAARGFGNGQLFPAGPLREPLSRLGLVDFRVWNGGVPSGEEGIGLWLEPDHAVHLLTGEARPLSAFAPGPVRAVAGIGSPQRFFASLEQQGIEVHPDTPGDHGVWQPDSGSADHAGNDRPVLMTDKDAVKLEAPAGADWWRVPVRARLAPETGLLGEIERLLSSAAAHKTDTED
jgi:tetraacyldisaccharide 4'-kinase